MTTVDDRARTVGVGRLPGGRIPSLGPALVRACGVQAGQRVLVVGSGSGNAAVPAAAQGATVTASDLQGCVVPHPGCTARAFDVFGPEAAGSTGLILHLDVRDVVTSAIVPPAGHHTDGNRATDDCQHFSVANLTWEITTVDRLDRYVHALRRRTRLVLP